MDRSASILIYPLAIMLRFTKGERTRILEVYIRTMSVTETQRDFRIHFKSRRSPSKNAIKSLVHKFRETGTVADQIRPGRSKSIRTEDLIDRVAADVRVDPKTSIRKRSSQLSISRSSLQRILKSDLKLFPYKIQLCQELLPKDMEARLNYAQSFLQLCEDDSFIENVMFSDEAHFHLSGYVNRHNSRIWSSENPEQTQERPLHSPRVTVWCGLNAVSVLGPYFFENDDGTTSTVTGEKYRVMIREFLIPEIERLGVHHAWFQQDGATSHTARETMALLREHFPGRLISRFGDLPWPPRSPDLTPPDFFLWGYLKSRVYVQKPSNLCELKARITQEVAAITGDMVNKVMEESVKRAQVCLNNRGAHLKDIIFKK